MNRKLSFSVDDEFIDIVKRYEQFLSGKATGYFDVEELESIVEYYLRRGRTKDCTKALELGLQLHPNNNALKTKRAKIYLFLGENHKASRILDKLTETSDYEVILLKIEVQVKMDNYKEAEQLINHLFLDEQEDIDNICLDIAYIYLGHANYDEALALLEKGDIQNKRNIELLYELAFCYEQAENYERAIETYNRILNIDSYSDEAWFNLGQIYFTLQEFPKALDAYEFALTIDENDSLTVLQKAHVHFQLDQFEPAIEAYLDYKRMTSNVWQTEIFVGECYEKMERYEESIAYYRLSLEAHPQNYDVLFTQLASHGVVVIASTDPNQEDGSKASTGVNWIVGQNEISKSEYYQKIIPSKVLAIGHSSGGAG
ncbi:MAG: tetratricopeptide repeat protein, partial [Paludibacter sp.]